MISISTALNKTVFRTRSTKKVSHGSVSYFRQAFSILTKAEKRHFRFLIVADIFISIVDILSLAFLLTIIQFYVQPQRSVVFSFLPLWMLGKNSVSLIALFFLLFSAKNVLAFLISKEQQKFFGTIAIRLSKNGLLNYQAGDFEQFVNVDSSNHIRRIAHQPFEFAQYILSGIQQIVTQSFLIFVAIIAVILFNAKLFFLLLLLLLPPVVAVFYFIKKRLSVYKSEIWYNNDKSFQYLMDALKGYVEANIYNRNKFFLDRFIYYRQKFSSYHFDSISLLTLPARAIEVFAVLGLFILIAIAKWLGGDNSAEFLTIGAFMAAAYKIIPGAVKIINAMGQIKAYELSILGLDQKAHSDDNNASQKKNVIKTVSFKNISFNYGDVQILKNFSFHLERGDFLGISGESGKGKTTILNLLLGLLSPCNGQVLINNNAEDSQSIKAYWPAISYVRQQAFLIHDSIRSNITFEEETLDAQALETAIQISGVNNIVSGTHERLDKRISENGKNISGGQQQRIVLARAIYNNAELILLDEPFNELDEDSELSLLNHFSQLAAAGKIIILITHNKNSLKFCNKIISLDEPGR
jgi:ABC-type bacteriocin/lantibiotic exporter with double-glycine peptidase domain